MTQTELAGNQITRNMLSSIENGSAFPSLSTALYIAERLNVPVGYLLAEERDEPAYRKMNCIENVRRALASKDWSGALAILNASCNGVVDDELSMIRARCEFGVGSAAVANGHLRMAVLALDRALTALGETVYDTAWLRSAIAVYFRYLSGISATLSSNILDEEEVERARCAGDELGEYMEALEKMEKDPALGREFVARFPDSPYARRLEALTLMANEDFVAAQAVLEGLLTGNELTFGLLLYEVIGDLEICYRKNDDYKRAYEFAGSRLGLLERLLEEI